MDNVIKLSKKSLLRKLWAADPKIKSILSSSKDLSIARERLFKYLNDLEELYFDVHGHSRLEHIHIFEKENAKECIRVMKNLIRSENEALTNFSALQLLIDISNISSILKAKEGWQH
jgi:lysine 2,3-aminomutase